MTFSPGGDLNLTLSMLFAVAPGQLGPDAVPWILQELLLLFSTSLLRIFAIMDGPSVFWATRLDHGLQHQLARVGSGRPRRNPGQEVFLTWAFIGGPCGAGFHDIPDSCLRTWWTP